MTTSYEADKWVVLKIVGTGVDESAPLGHTQYRLLCASHSGYPFGWSWQLNSGICQAIDIGKGFLFDGASGSQYYCPKDGYGLQMASLEGLRTLERNPLYEVQVLTKNVDWPSFEWKDDWRD